MKHRYFYILLMLLAAVSCSIVIEEPAVQDVIEEPSVSEEGINIIVNARLANESDDAQTKVTISQVDETHYNMNWSASGETALLIESRQKDWQISRYNSTSAELTGDSMAFSFESVAPQKDQDWANGKGFGYDIIYPGTVYVSGSDMTATLSLPAAQTPQANSPDAAASLLCGRVGVFEKQPTTALNAEFSHLAAYCKMTLIGIPAGESITSIAFTAADYNIAGDLTYNTWSREVAYTATEEHTITLAGTNLVADPDGFDVWFACKPFTLEAGHSITVVTTTSEGDHSATLKAKYDMAFAAGVVTSFPTVNKCVVTFESNGGTVVAPVAVKKGQIVSEPSAPTKAVDLVQGLYPGDIDPDACYATFGGWYTDPECTVPYDFDTAVTASFTLYAKWTEPARITPDDIKWINHGFTYATKNAGTYTFVLTGDASSGAVLTLNNASSTMVVAGKGSERIVSSTVNWQAAIRAQSGTVILANNTTVTNTAGPAAMLADGGNIIMRAGSKVKNCSVFPIGDYTDVRGVVYINNASSTFTLDGGEITGNTMTGVSNNYLAATVCANNGNIVINTGSITNNTVTRASGSQASVGGAICLPYRNDGAVLRKTGGVISGNSVVDDSKVNSRVGQQVISYTISGTRHYYTIDDAIGEEVTFDAINFSSPLWTLVEPL